jgi:threonine dehydrogenase-like Zn-dependent dehydrogenase
MNSIDTLPLGLNQEGTKTFHYKAALIDQPRSLKWIEMEKGEIGAKELFIKMEGVGLCASNLPVWEGREWFEYPLQPGVPGHEGWGTIQEIGEEVTGYQVGQRVAILQANAFAEYLRVAAEDTVLLPPELNGFPFPGEPLGCLMNIMERADIKQGQTVAIIGMGFIGLGLTRLCKEKGARVVALSRRISSLDMASDHADQCILMDDHYKIINSMNEYTQRLGFERVIECTGKQWPLDLATEIIGNYGKLVIAGYHQDGLRNVNMQQWNWKAIDVINAHERDPEKYKQGILQAVNAVQRGILNPNDLLSHPYSFDELGKGLEVLREGPEGFVKGYVKF